jgi:transcriptional regulator with XRE-family HTH domain
MSDKAYCTNWIVVHNKYTFTKVLPVLDSTDDMRTNTEQNDPHALDESLDGSSLVHGDLALQASDGGLCEKNRVGQRSVADHLALNEGTQAPAKANATRGSADAKRRRCSKSTLGEVLQKRRHALGMTQRELANRLGVKGAHVAYLEGGRRRPSLGLLGRIGEVLGLDRERLFALAHPEASSIFGRKQPQAAAAKGAAWTEFSQNRALRVQHQINARELKILSQVNLLGKISSPRHFMFILNAIRQAVDEE